LDVLSPTTTVRLEQSRIFYMSTKIHIVRRVWMIAERFRTTYGRTPRIDIDQP
jgi:aspartyl/asparaginyl-tRNA synthetase